MLLVWFQEGGQFMWLVLITFMVSIILILLSSKGGTNQTHLKGLALILLPLVIGLLGFYLGYQEAYSAVANVDPSMKEELLAASSEVARIPAIFGGLLSISLLFLFIIISYLSKRNAIQDN